MPHNHRSLSISNAYRRRIAAIGKRADAHARRGFPKLGELDASRWPEQMAAVITQGQLEGLRAASGYLAAFYLTETGKRISPPALPRDTVGQARDGRPLLKALQSPLIGVKAALKDGKAPADAIRIGLARATRTAAFEVVQTSREALLTAIDDSPYFDGWQRSTSGTCAACMELSGNGGPHFEVHPGCECQPTPRISGLKDRFPIPSGAALFASKTTEEQDAALGADAAEKVRNGDLDLSDLVAHSPQATGQDFITQAPTGATSH